MTQPGGVKIEFETRINCVCFTIHFHFIFYARGSSRNTFRVSGMILAGKYFDSGSSKAIELKFYCYN